MEMPFCRFCGMRIPADALFCGSCGKALTPVSPEQTNLSAPIGLTNLSQPLPPLSQPLPRKRQDKDEDERDLLPFAPPPEPPTPASAPLVHGTPQVGSVPSVPSTPSMVTTVTSATTKAGMTVSIKALLVAVAVVVVVTGIVKIAPIVLKGGNHPGNTITTTGTAPIITKPMLPTQTNCPATGTARAAITAPLALGKHQNLVYAGTPFGPPSNSVLVRHDMVTGQSTAIEQLSNKAISDAEVSADGQWVLFSSYVTGQTAIQMVRMDGQGLQTLYCTSVSIYGISWSINQKLVMFDQDTSFYLLNLTTGTVQKELTIADASNFSYLPRMWFDNTHIALLKEKSSDTTGNMSIEGIYALDINKGANQQISNLELIYKASSSCVLIYYAPSSCFDFDINPKHTDFFLRNYPAPGSISVLPVTGGTAHTIFTTQNFGIQIMQVISDTMLLIYLESSTDKGELYKVHSDGTHLTKIFSRNDFDPGYGPVMDNFSVSRDASMYMFEAVSCGNACHPTLLYGSLRGGKPTALTDKYDNYNLHDIIMAGWTTM